MSSPTISTTPKSSLTSLTSYLLVGKILSFALSVALPLLLVRRLSQYDLGIYKQAFLLVGTTIVLLPLGFHLSAYYFVPREPENRGAVVFNILLVHLFMTSLGGLALALFPELLTRIFNSPALVPYAGLLGCVIVLWGLAAFVETAVVANQEARLAGSIIFAAQLTKTGMLVLAGVIFGSVKSLIIAAILQGLLQTAVLLYYLQSRFQGYWRRIDWHMFSRQVGYALPLGLAGLLYTLELDFHNYFVSNQFGPVVFAIYSIGCTQLPLVTLLTESVASAMMLRASLLQQQNQRREILELMARVARKLALVYFPLYVFLMAAGRVFILAAFTPRYEASWPVFAINLTLIPFLIFLTDPVVRAYATERHTLMWLHVFILASMALILWKFGAALGPVGIIGVVVGANIFARMFMLVRVLRLTGVAWSDLSLMRGVGIIGIAALLAALPVLAAESLLPTLKPVLLLMIVAAVYGLSYAIGLLALKVIESDEWAMIYKGLGPVLPKQIMRRLAPNT